MTQNMKNTILYGTGAFLKTHIHSSQIHISQILFLCMNTTQKHIAQISYHMSHNMYYISFFIFAVVVTHTHISVII